MAPHIAFSSHRCGTRTFGVVRYPKETTARSRGPGRIGLPRTDRESARRACAAESAFPLTHAGRIQMPERNIEGAKDIRYDRAGTSSRRPFALWTG